MSSAPQSVLFDIPSTVIPFNRQIIPPSNAPLSQIDSVFNLKIANYFFLLFLIVLIIQYICIFITVPCDQVLNRSLICVLSSFFDAIMFIVCCCMFPFSSIEPSLRNFYFLSTSAVFQSLGLILSIPAFVQVLHSESMYLYEYDHQLRTSIKVDITIYIRIVTLLSLFFHSLGFILSIINCFIAYRGLSYLNNRIDRRLQHITSLEFNQKLPKRIIDEQIKLYRA